MSQIQPLGIAWAGLHAEHLPTLVDFYAHQVGFHVIERDDRCCILDAGGGALFELWGKGHAAAQRKTTEQQSFVVGFLVERLEPVVEALSARGVHADTAIDSYLGTRWIYFTDPEGNQFEFKDMHGA